jgi:hypothetical protein
VNTDGFNANAEAGGNWQPPPELTRATPRPVGLTGQGIAASCVAVLVMAGSVFLGAWLHVRAGREHALAQSMAAEGVVISGQITGIGPARGKGSFHRVDYRYRVDGQIYNSNASVAGRAAGNLEGETRVLIRYLRTDPAQSWLVGYEPQINPYWAAPLAGLSMVVASSLLFLLVKRQRFLLAEGRVARGHVTGVRWISSGQGGRYIVKYQFQLSGGTYKGSFKGSKKTEGATGTPVTILYDQDNPQRNTRYPSPFVRIAE